MGSKKKKKIKSFNPVELIAPTEQLAEWTSPVDEEVVRKRKILVETENKCGRAFLDQDFDMALKLSERCQKLYLEIMEQESKLALVEAL